MLEQYLRTSLNSNTRFSLKIKMKSPCKSFKFEVSEVVEWAMDVFEREPIKASDRSVTISAAAAKRLGEIFAAEENPNLMLRISVSGGGCSGFQYGFEFADNRDQDDYLFERDGVKVIVDDTSLNYLSGSEIDFVTEMVGSSFQVNNPNATSGCGCGASFSM